MTGLNLLAIETSSAIGSIAVRAGCTVSEETIATPREQTPRILAIVDELLNEAGLTLADLDALVFGRGPGSFTGLRVAAAVVQGLSFSSGVPIVSVSSLATLAERAFEGRLAALADASAGAADAPAAEQVLCCIDARMGEVYSASFDWTDGRAKAASDERIGPPGAVTAPGAPFVAVGDGLSAYPEALAKVAAAAAGVDPSLVPSARQLLALGSVEVEAGRFLPVEAALPVYLRGADAWKKS